MGSHLIFDPIRLWFFVKHQRIRSALIDMKILFVNLVMFLFWWIRFSVLQKPLQHGATLVLHSGTKFLGGHGDVMAGLISCSEEWARRLRQVRILTGVFSLKLHGSSRFADFSVRVRCAQRNARFPLKDFVIILQLVLYPELPGTTQRTLWVDN